jgi:hypothetical protein
MRWSKGTKMWLTKITIRISKINSISRNNRIITNNRINIIKWPNYKPNPKDKPICLQPKLTPWHHNPSPTITTHTCRRCSILRLTYPPNPPNKISNSFTRPSNNNCIPTNLSKFISFFTTISLRLPGKHLSKPKPNNLTHQSNMMAAISIGHK